MNVQNVNEENIEHGQDERNPFISQDLIVGSDDCKIPKVAAIIAEHLSLLEWPKLAGQLDCKSNQIETWRLELAHSKYTYEDLCNKILEKWNMSKSNNAKLSTLLYVFDSLDMEKIRDKLLEKFPIPYKPLRKRREDEKENKVKPVVLQETQLPNSDKVKCCIKLFVFFIFVLFVIAFLVAAIVLICGIISINFPPPIAQNYTKCESNIEEGIVNRLGWLNITSSDEYDRLIPLDRYSRIYLKLTHPSHWAPTTVKNRGCTIKEFHISDNYTSDTLIDILNEFPNLEMINIEDGSIFTRKIVHSSFSKPLWFPKKYPKLKTLMINLKESDLSILQVLTYYINLDTVEKLRLVVANVNNDNVEYIRRLLSATRMLKYLNILVHFKTVIPLFEINTALVNVEEIIFNILDESYNGNIPLYELGEHFYETFPNLSSFNSSSGALLYTARSQILQCENLQSLQINFYHNTTSVVSLGLYDKLPRLQSANIWIEFDKSKCPHMSKLLSLNNEKIQNPESNLKICSNSCPINTESFLGCIGAIKNPKKYIDQQ